ncbi:Crp/Fnr family transcriptional regulator [Saccharothrix longispora]|uniref:Crp/Fnr family transcriptional regulator n=1 Tax=Saccharothrix longispora TaxID=33920 RepID=UPI0028FDAD8F|nr:Crp/Fnr family transcriptional regulator [Saccharothrix longispora]MDU0292530.1 Crp/Fnr family transcriptional regulator [Saccharothrix longispora]
MGKQTGAEFDDGGLMAELEPAERAELRRRGTVVNFPAGGELLRQSDASTHVYFLLKGLVRVSMTSDDGNPVLLAVRGPGDVLGEMALLDGQPRSATVTALSEVSALLVTREAMEDLITQHPKVGRLLTRQVVHRLRESGDTVSELASHNVSTRLATRLMELVKWGVGEADGENGFVISITQQELAVWVSTTRESVVRALRDLRQRGLVEATRGRLKIVDVARLGDSLD